MEVLWARAHPSKTCDPVLVPRTIVAAAAPDKWAARCNLSRGKSLDPREGSVVQTLELWGGHECTVNRVGKAFRDQTVLSGHEAREDDLDAFASLGLKTLRYPILWERVAPERPDVSNWSWTDRRLERLRNLKLRPIAGLCHHGSGPAYVDLLSPAFAPGLAAHARAA